MVLVVNGEPIPDAEIRLEVDRIRVEFEDEFEGGDPIAQGIRLRDIARENLIERALLAQAAGGDLPKLTGQIYASVIPPEPAELQNFYTRHRQEFWRPEMVHAAHIVKNVEDGNQETAAREAIQAAYNEIKSGSDFATVADRVSDCKGDGGNLGWFPKGQMVQEFEDIVFAMSAGKTSAIFRTPFGFHIAHVFGKRPAGIPRFAEVRAEIEEELLRERKRAALAAYIADLRKGAKIERVHESLLHSEP